MPRTMFRRASARVLHFLLLAAAALLAACGGGQSGDGGLVAGSGSAGPGPLVPMAAPAIQLNTNNDYWLQVGNSNDAYWVENNTWGAGSLTAGTGSNQYEQQTGIDPQPGPNGEVAFRTKWRWPAGQTEVKGYPSIVYGRKPGYASSSSYVNGAQIRLPDGSYSQAAPSGATPGTFLPLQLPIQALTSKFNFTHLSAPTGQGQLVYDLWLQSAPQQDSGFANSSITHEIMIVLDNWGGYGAYPNGRNPGWYDHDVTINGKLWHVYATKGQDGSLLYNFGSLNGNYGRTGWKMIAFVPDQSALPVAPGELDLAAFVNYLPTRTDAYGNRWANGNEYLVSVELGVEPVEGTGDITVYDYKISQSTPTSGTPTNPTTFRVQAESGTLQGSGVSAKTDFAGYDGSGFVGSFTQAGDSVAVSVPGVPAGSYDLRIRYQAWSAQQNDVAINGNSQSQSFPATGNAWGTKTISGLTLAAGTQTLAITKDWGYMEVDYFELVPSGGGAGGGGTPTTIQVQAESGTVSGSGVGVHNDQAGYEGSGFVGNFTQAGDTLTVSLPSVVAATYNLRIRYQAWTAQQNDVRVNGAAATSMAFPATGSGWQVATLSGISLPAGTTMVAISKDWGYMNVDWIEVVPVP